MANLRVDKITSTETFETTGSVQFDGTGDYLSIPNNADFRLNATAEDFTIECWALCNSSGTQYIAGFYNFGDSRRSWILYFSNRIPRFTFSNDGSATFGISGNEVPQSQWVHVSVVKKDSIITIYQNGKKTDESLYSGTFLSVSADEFRIGCDWESPSRFWDGHISNLRIVKGKALYTSNFKPPMRELEVVPGTVLLACQSKTDATLEKTGKTITVNGNAVANELTPGLLTPIVKSGGGSAITGSVEFTSTSDALVLSAGTDFAYGTGDFTIEAWIQPQGINGGETKAIFTQTQSGNDYIVFKVDSDKAIKATFGSTTVSGGTVEVGSWHHVAVTRASNTVKIFVNGVASAGTTVSTDFSDTTRNPTIGQYTHTYGNIEYYGFISNLRVNKGTALYTDNFIPPTRELKRVPGTVLLCCQDSNDPTQEATGKTISLNGIYTYDTVVNSGITTAPGPSNFTPQVGDDRQVTFEGVTKVNSNAYFYLPTGNTESREATGTYNAGTRGVIAGGYRDPAISNIIEYIGIASKGNSKDFGDLTSARRGMSGFASNTRGIFAGGNPNSSPNLDNKIDYITIATTGNAKDFGDCVTKTREGGAAGNQTRGILHAAEGPSSTTATNSLQYVTIQTSGNAIDFGDLTFARTGGSGQASSPTRGIFFGGYFPSSPNRTNTIDYVTIATTSNAIDFGDMIGGGNSGESFYAVCSNSTRAIRAGGVGLAGNVNRIDYITIATLGDAQDFGDLSTGRAAQEPIGSCASSTRGVIAGGFDSPAFLNIIDYVTIQSTGNAQDFGDTITPGSGGAGFSNGHGGLG